MRYSENLSNIASALADVQSEIRNPIKNNINNGVQGAPKYANLEDTLAEYVRPITSKHGISIFQSLKSDDAGRVGVCTTLLHKSGEYIEGDYVFCEIKIPISKAGKEVLTQGQATGVNITYLRRYSLNAALGINGDKDTDGSMGEAEEEEPITSNNALDYVFTFGKHNGDTLREVWKNDFDYIKWLSSNEKTDKKTIEAIKLVSEKIRAEKAEKVSDNDGA